MTSTSSVCVCVCVLVCGVELLDINPIDAFFCFFYD